MSVDYGNVPEWVGSIGALLYFFVTAGLFKNEVAARRSQEQTQARSVSVSRGCESGGVPFFRLGDDPHRNDDLITTDVVVWIKNDSSMPITHVQLAYALDGAAPVIKDLEELGAGRPDELRETHQGVIETDLVTGWAEFTDAEGRRWKRTANGHLSQTWLYEYSPQPWRSRLRHPLRKNWRPLTPPR